MNKKFIIVSVFALFVACRPTVLLQENKTKYFAGNPMNKLSVIAFPGEMMDIKTFESTLASAIRDSKHEVIEGYKVFEGADSIPEDAAAIRNELKRRGFNGVLEIKFVSIRQEELSTAGDDLTRREYRIMDVANYGKLIQEYDKREEKGATFQDTKVKMDIRLFDLMQNEQQVIWSIRTESENPKTVNHVAKGMSAKAKSSIKRLKVLPEN